MPTVSKLDVEIGAKDRTKRAFAKVNRAMKTLKKGAFAAAAAVGAIGVGLVVAIKKAVNFADAIGKTADKIGITTTELQKLRFAFDIGGMAVEHTDKALTVFSRNIGDLRQGTGTLTTFMRKLGDHGLNEVLMKTGRLTPKLSALMQKMREMATQSDAVALGVAAFGRQGAALAAIARKGRMELEKFTKKAEQLGIILSEKMVRGAEDLKDKMTILEYKLKATFNQMILTFGPQIGLLIQDITNLVFALSVKVVDLAKRWGLISKNKIDLIADSAMKSLKIAEVEIELQKKRKILDDKNFRLRKGRTRSEIKQLEEKKAALENEQKTLRRSIKAFDVVEKLREKSTLRQTPVVPTKQKELLKSLGQTFIGPETDDDILSPATVAFQKLAQAIDAADEKVETLKETVITSRTPIGEWRKAAQDMDAAMQQIAVSGADAMTESLMGMIRGTKNAKEAFSEFASSVIKDLQRMLVKKLIVDKIFGFVTQAIGLPETKTTKTKPKRFGGPVAGQKPVLVGEAGPEIFYPNTAGNIVANKKIGGGSTIVQNFDFSGANPATVDLLRQEAERIKNETFNAVFGSINRGGSYARISGRR